MAPRNTRNGASAAARRTGSNGARAAAVARTSRTVRPKSGVGKSPPSRSARSAFGLPARLAEVIPLRPEFAGLSSRSAERGGASKPSAKRRAACDESAAKWWTLPLAILLVFGAFTAAYYPVLRVQYREYRDRARLAAELEAIQARNTRLEAEVARLRTPEGVEDYARTQLGLAKRGEHVVVVRDMGAPKEPVAVQAVPEIDSDRVADEAVGPWTDFLDLVFGVQ